MAKALLILDAQNICPTAAQEPTPADLGEGEFPAVSGKEIAEPLLALAHSIVDHGGTTFAARPAGVDVAGLCLRGTYGARWNPRLRLPEGTVIVTPSDGGARVLDRRDDRGRTLGELLRRGRIAEVLVGGVTTSDEFRDAVAELRGAKIPTAVLADAVFALDAAPGAEPSMAGFAFLGARVVSTGQAIMELYGWRDEYPAPTEASGELYPPRRDPWAREQREKGWRKMLAGMIRSRRPEGGGPRDREP